MVTNTNQENMEVNLDHHLDIPKVGRGLDQGVNPEIKIRKIPKEKNIPVVTIQNIIITDTIITVEESHLRPPVTGVTIVVVDLILKDIQNLYQEVGVEVDRGVGLDRHTVKTGKQHV